MDCVFCKIINNEIPSYTIYEDQQVKVFLDINPKSSGHCLVIPKNHYIDLYDIPENELIYINNICKKISKHIKNKLECDGFTLANNIGCTQEVKHFHIHIIPIYNKNKNIDITEVWDSLKTDTLH